MELFPGILCLSKDFKTLKAFSSQITTEGFLDIEETKPLFICCAYCRVETNKISFVRHCHYLGSGVDYSRFIGNDTAEELLAPLLRQLKF